MQPVTKLKNWQTFLCRCFHTIRTNWNKPENPFQTMTSQIILFKPIQTSQLNPNLSESIRVYPSRSESIQVNPSRSKLIQVDWSRPESIRVDPSLSKSIQIDLSRFQSIQINFSRFGSIRFDSSRFDSNLYNFFNVSPTTSRTTK